MARRKKATKKAAAKAAKAAAKVKPEKHPKGSISSTIYDTVEKLVADGKVTRAAAFRQLAKQTGRKEGTVAVNYYYAAKKRGAKLRKRGRPAGKHAAARIPGQPRALSLLTSLKELVRGQAAELEALRRSNAGMSAIRKLVGRA